MSERILHKYVVVPTDLASMWQTWTTNEGAATFFAPATNIELRLGGAYEIFFFPENPPGQRGGEGLTLLSYLPQRMLSFEWNAPPQWPDIRGQHTMVVIFFEEAADGVLVDFHHLGWGEGQGWDEVYAYFEEAWDVVLGRLVERFTDGPIDWVALRAAQQEEKG